MSGVCEWCVWVCVWCGVWRGCVWRGVCVGVCGVCMVCVVCGVVRFSGVNDTLLYCILSF